MTQPFNKRKVSSCWSIAQSTQQLPRTLIYIESWISHHKKGWGCFYPVLLRERAKEFSGLVAKDPQHPPNSQGSSRDRHVFLQDWIWSKVSKWNDSRDAWNPSLWEFCKVTSAGKPGDVKANVSPIRTIRNLTLKGKESYLTVCFLALGKEGVMTVRCHVLGKVLQFNI